MALKDNLERIIGTTWEADVVIYLLENPGEHTQADLSKGVAKAQPEISIAINSLIQKGFIQKSLSGRPSKYQIPSLRWLREQFRFYEETHHSELLFFIDNL